LSIAGILNRKWVKIILLTLGYLIVMAGLVALIWFFQTNLGVALNEYASIAYLSVFIVALLSSATILIPVTGTAFIATAAATWNPAIVALVACTGTAFGEMTSYLAGYFGRAIIKPEHLRGYKRAKDWMERYGIWAVFGFALVPVILFDIVGLAAGGLKLTPWKFWLACWSGKLPRSFLEAYAGAGLLHLLLHLLLPSLFP